MNNNEKKEEELEILESNNSDNIEIMDFNKKEEKLVNTLEEKKENKIMFVIIGVVILAVILLPTITSLFNTSSTARYTSTVDDIESNKTVDGMLEIGNEEGSITAKKIQFYGFMKRTGNTLSFSYLPEQIIDKGSINNIYIELYNARKNIIYRTNFEITEKLERKILKTFRLSLNENIYSEAMYAKVVLLENRDFLVADNELKCTMTAEDDYKIVDTNVTYTISKNGLSKYHVEKEASIKKQEKEILEENNEELDELNENNQTSQITEEELSIFEEEYKSLEEYNINDLLHDNTSISYTIDLVNNKIDKPLYKLGDAARQIKLYSESSGWKCE